MEENIMKFKHILAVLLFVSATVSVWAQARTITLDATTNGTSYQYSAMAPLSFTDDNAGPGTSYTLGNDFHVSISSDSCNNPYRLCLYLEELDIADLDTLFIYDGPTTSSRLLYKLNNSTNSRMLNRGLFVSSTNASQTLTIRFKTSAASTTGHRGFSLRAACAIPCEIVEPLIDSVYYRTVNGQVVDTMVWKKVYTYDTIQMTRGGETFDTVVKSDSIWGFNLCKGMGIIFNGHGVFTNDYGYYTPTDDNTEFHWTFGNGDSLFAVGAHTVPYEKYNSTDCYDVQLTVTDVQGCSSTTYAQVRVRLAINPIKTIYSLPSICNNDSLLINVGYDGDNAQLTLQKISFVKRESKSYDVLRFCPDGKACPVPCFEAKVTFNEFPNGRKVQSAADICSVCANMEHEYLGDCRLSLICPTGQTAVLQWGTKGQDPGVPEDAPTGSYGGGGTYLGYPYGLENHHTYDGSPTCDSIGNYYGIGLEYCFSRNYEYTLVDGTMADVPVFNTVVPSYIGNGSADYKIPATDPRSTIVFAPIPAPFNQAGQDAGQHSSSNIKLPSNHENRTGYYTPYSDFHELIGCPLNGDWQFQVCDQFASDNGWIFGWSMDICNVSSGTGCEYQVGIDSVTWGPDPAESDYELGHYRGLVVNAIDSVSGYISSPDTAGRFRVILTVHDEFGCDWDTNTSIRTVWVPEPNLGNDTVLCDVQTTVLDASDRHAATENYTYVWEPTGESTATIATPQNPGNDIIYTVEVTNTINTGMTCFNRDSITVSNSPQPIPNFDPGVYPLEGCEPFTINITNTSQHGDHYLWDFGDGVTSTEENPSHTYAAGVYDFKYYIYSDGGCADSLLYTQLIAVYPSPSANFSWDPVYPTVLQPTVQFENRTNPLSEDYKYFWEIQYDKDAPYSVHTLTDMNPSFTWNTTGEDISGTYSVRLIARSDNLPPSGNIVQCADTAEAAILLVNDFLQFPNVVTPNGDGINDKFVIKNLVEGLAYPINQLDIYNRWGSRVFHKENISNEDDFWDPANAPAGTYFYKFTAHGYNGNIDHNGTIEVIK